MTGWDVAQWVVILGLGGTVGWLTWRVTSALARFTESITASLADAVALKRECLGVHASFTSALVAGTVADQQHNPHVEKPRDVSETGWLYVLLQADGSVESIRKATDGSAPIRIARGHGQRQAWYRLTRIDGNSLIYIPEPQA